MSKKSDTENGLTFSENWQFYPSNIDETPISVRFDAAVEDLPEKVKKQYKHIIELNIPFIEPKENGFPTPSEMERINGIEDDFSRGAYDVRLIGVITGGYCCRFVFCFNGSEKDVENVVRTLMGANLGIDFNHRIFIDDDFGYYDALVSPSVYEENWFQNFTVCNNLENDGEAFSEPREIDFYCCFATEQHIRAVTDELTKQGFAADDPKKGEDGEYMLHLVLEGIPTLNWINDITNGIIELLEDTDGYLDGWGSPIIRDK
jgi:hypothetical protein